MVLIIGTGHAGYTLAREFRKLDAQAPLALLTRDDGASYYKPDLSKAHASGKDAESVVKARAERMAEDLRAEVRTGVTVTALEPAAHRVRIGPEAVEYRQLVLALGAEVVRVPIGGDAADRVFSVNSRRDYARFRAAQRPGCRLLILGAGLIGSEFANDHAAAGFRVTVVDLAAHPLPRLVPEPCGRALQSALEGLGVRFHLGTSVATVNAAGSALRATLEDGTAVEADVALSAVGLRPNLALAGPAGLRTNAGIVVDDLLRTSAADVYALGDCIEIAGRPLPFILPISHGARALAATLAGRPTPVHFPPMPVSVKTPACPVIVCPPPPEARGRWRVAGSAPDLEALFEDASGQPLGFALTGTATARRGALAARMPPVRAAG